MALSIISSGVDTNFSTKLNSNFNSGWSIGIYSADGTDLWGEAYIDSNGRNNIVVGTNAEFDSDKFKVASTLTIDVATTVGASSQANTYVELIPLFTGSLTSFQSKWAGNTGSYQVKLYKNGIEVHDFGTLSRTSGTVYTYTPTTAISVVSGNVIKLQNETDGTDVGYYIGTYANTNPYFTSTGTSYALTSTGTINAVFTISSTEITHTIPSGKFSSTISSATGSGIVEDWEDGADIKYKLTNATEDSGWLNYNEISNFTAFTSEPTKYIVKLIPKTTSPTAGYPSIKGFALRAE